MATKAPTMVFVKDEGSYFDASLDEVWNFVGSGSSHREAHHHRDTRTERISENCGVYSWEQDFLGKSARFSMRWTTYYPMGIVYEVLAGPFEGSNFFLFYAPDGDRTGVSVVGEFISPEIPRKNLKDSVMAFFALEFEQDSQALSHRLRVRS